MDELVWSGGKRRAWAMGAAFGVVGGILSAAVGTVVGFCCMFQFANALLPLLLGLLGGGVASAAARWEEMPREGAAVSGALLGLRGGGLAAVLAGGLGLLFTLLWPVLSAVFRAVGSEEDLGVTLVLLASSLAISTGLGFVFTGVGVVGGVLLSAGAGAVAGFLRAR